jgi:hypothetical protein
MTGGRGTFPRRLRAGGAATLTVLALLLLSASAAMALTVANPPASAGSGFSLKVKGATGTLSLYLSPVRKLAKGDLSLGKVKPKHGAVRLKIGSKVKPGGWYVVLCSGKGRHAKCASSKRSTTVIPSIPKVAPTGVSGAASPATAKAVTGTIPGTGGSLSVTGADGTKYTLAFDAHSVVAGTQITLTPLTGLSGAGLGKFIDGVEISATAADGPAFARGGILVITPPHPIPFAKRTALQFTGTGQGIHVIPQAPQSKPITLPVAAPGGYALVSGGSQPDLRRAAARRADSVPADDGGGGNSGGPYQQAIAGMAQTLAGTGQDIGDGSAAADAYQSAVISTLNEWYNEITSSEVPDGLQDDDAANTAIQDLTSWAQTGATALGDGAGSVGGVNGYSESYNGMSAAYGPNWQQSKVLDIDQKLAAAAYNRDQQKCADDNDLTQIPNILQWYRSDVLFGHADDLSVTDLLACANFTLDFDSTIVSQYTVQGFTGSWTNEYTVSGLTIAPDSLGNETGTGFGSYEQATGTETDMTPCQYPDNTQGTATTTITDEGGTGDDFTVSGLTLATTPGESPVLTIDPGEPKENQDVNYNGCGQNYSIPGTNSIWVSFFSVAHAADYVSGGFALTLNPGGGSTYGTATFSNSPDLPGSGSGSETTMITVTQTPQPYPSL